MSIANHSNPAVPISITSLSVFSLKQHYPCHAILQQANFTILQSVLQLICGTRLTFIHKKYTATVLYRNDEDDWWVGANHGPTISGHISTLLVLVCGTACQTTSLHWRYSPTSSNNWERCCLNGLAESSTKLSDVWPGLYWGGFNSWCGTFISVCNQPPRSTQPGQPFMGRCNALQPNGSWGVEAGIVRVWVAGKTVWSHCYTRVISERFGDKRLIIKHYINSPTGFTF